MFYEMTEKQPQAQSWPPENPI